MEITVLIADDDYVFRELLCDMFQKLNYTIIQAGDGEEALNAFYNNEIDVIILDVMMPNLSGWEVLDEIRMQSEVPIVMLTALDNERSEIKGLHAGADDYITKPFSYPVFMARIQTLVRRLEKNKKSILECGCICINKLEHRVYVDGDEALLNNKEFCLLEYFMENQDLILTRDMILDKVWGLDFDGDVRTIDTHVKTLRAKLNEYHRYIKTIRGTGYRFEVN